MIDINELRQSLGAIQTEEVAELLDRLEAAEKKCDDVAQQLVQSEQGKRKISEECDALRTALRHEADCVEAAKAKIEAMERQKPVVSVWRCDNNHIHGSCEQTLPMGAKLYALPGAQHAPSVPGGFAWPECPKRRQSHVLFDDGYEEGWAACIAAVKVMLAAAPEAKP